jgi:Fe-S cluster biogenesis protein NfuA
MLEEKAFQQRLQRIEVLIERLEEAGDPSLRACAKDLVRLIMELHGGGLEQMIQIVSQTGDAAQHIIGRFDRHDLVRSLLLLHGLHPLDFEARVRRALEKVGPSLHTHGARVELLSVTDGVVRLQLLGSLKGCGAPGVKAALEEAIYAAAPDLSELVVEAETEAASSAFVPLTSLLNHSIAGRGSERP